MKKLPLIALLVAMPLFASNDEEMADKELVSEIYEYCVSMQETETSNDKALLECVNEELKYSEYKGFSSIEAVRTYIKSSGDE